MQKFYRFVFAIVVSCIMLVSCSNDFSKDSKLTSVSLIFSNKVFNAAYKAAREVVSEDVDIQDFMLEVSLYDKDENCLEKESKSLDQKDFSSDEAKESFTTNVTFPDVLVNTEVYAEAVIYYIYKNEIDESGQAKREYLLQGKSDLQKVVKEGITLKLKVSYPFSLLDISVNLNDVEYDDSSVISSITIDKYTGTMTAKVNDAIDLNTITVTWLLGDLVVTGPNKITSRNLEFNLFEFDIPYEMGKNDITLLIMYDGVPYTTKTTLELEHRE